MALRFAFLLAFLCLGAFVCLSQGAAIKGNCLQLYISVIWIGRCSKLQNLKRYGKTIRRMKNPAPWRAQVGLLKKRREIRRTRDCTGRNARYSIQQYSLPGEAGAGQGTRTPYPSYISYLLVLSDWPTRICIPTTTTLTTTLTTPISTIPMLHSTLLEY